MRARIRMTSQGAKIGDAAAGLPGVRKTLRRALRARAVSALVLDIGQVPVAFSARFAPGLHREIVKARRFIAARNSEDEQLRAKVEAMLRRAGRTLLRLPPLPEIRWLNGSGSSWPKVLREFSDFVGNKEEWMRRTHPRPSPASPVEIAELDAVLDWLIRLDKDERFVVMGKMIGLGFRRIAKLDRNGRSFMALSRLYQRALDRIIQWLKLG